MTEIFNIHDTDQALADRELALAQEHSKAREQKDLLQGLVNTAGWFAYKLVMEAQYDARVQQIMLKPATPDTVLEQEFLKGEAAMIKTALLLPEAFIESDAVTLGRRGEDDEDGS